MLRLEFEFFLNQVLTRTLQLFSRSCPQMKGASSHLLDPQSTLRSHHNMLTSNVHLKEFTNLVRRNFEAHSDDNLLEPQVSSD